MNAFTIFAGLRHDYISAPASRRGAEPLATFPSYFDTSDGTIKLECGSTPTFSSFWKPGVPSSSPSYHSLLSLGSKYGCQSPKLSRLQQQVTKFKLLKLAQSQGTCPRAHAPPVCSRAPSPQMSFKFGNVFGRNHHRPHQVPFEDQPALPAGCEEQPKFRHGRSPACRLSNPSPTIRWAKETNAHKTSPKSGGVFFFYVIDAFSLFSGAPADKSWSPSLSGGSMRPLAMLPSVRDPEKRLERSQSASPCKIPHAPKGHLSINGRVFASPERRTTPAWALGGPSNQREKVSRHEY